MARAQTGTIILSVTSAATPIVVNQNCTYVVIQENASSPANAFTITLPGQSTGIAYPAGTKFVFQAGPGGYVNGQSLGTITVSGGTVAFIGIESKEAPTVPALSKNGNGGSGPSVDTNGTPNISQTVLNFETSTANVTGLTVTPSNPSGGIEKFEVTGSIAGGVSATTDNTWTNQNRFAGPDPHKDITAGYGGRSIRTEGAGTTGAITSGSHSLTIGSATTPSGYVKGVVTNGYLVGDGIDIQGAGPTNTLSTPAAPTVTPRLPSGPTSTGLTNADVNGGGATSNSYKVVAIDLGQGYTAASPAGTTTTARATLGKVTIPLIGCVSSYVTASNPNQGASYGTLICQTTSAHGLNFYDVVSVEPASQTGPNVNGGEIGGWYPIVDIPDTTHFTVATAISNPQTTTGGNAVTFASNKIAIADVGAYQYAIYKLVGSTYTYLGMTWPAEGQSYVPHDISFDDYGSPMSDSFPKPYWLPATAPSAGTNDTLVTTVTGGAGTIALTLTAAAAHTVGATSCNGSTCRVVFDSVPAILAAAAVGLRVPYSTIFIPAPSTLDSGPEYSAVIESTLTLPVNTVVQQDGQIYVDAPIILTQGDTWTGNYGVAPVYIDGASPGMSLGGMTGFGPYVTVNNTNFVAQNPNGQVLLHAFAASYVSLNNDNFDSNGGTADYQSMGLVATGGGDFEWNTYNLNFLNGPDQVTDKTWSPAVYLSTQADNWTNSTFNRRGIYGSNERIINAYAQGLITPLFTTAGSNTCPYIDMGHSDSSYAGIYTSLYPGATSCSMTLANLSGNAGNVIQGGPVGSVSFLGASSYSTVDMNQNYAGDFAAYTSTSPLGYAAFAEGFHIVAERTLHPYQVTGLPTEADFYEPAPSTVSGAVVSSGGSVPVGAHNYQVVGLFAENTVGGTHFAPITVATTTSGNQTVTLTWTAIPGASKYLPVRDGAYVLTTSCGIGGGYAIGVAALTCIDTAAGTGNNGGEVPSGGYPMRTALGDYPTFVESQEAAAPTYLGTGWDQIYPDSSTHRWMMKNNGGAATAVFDAADFATIQPAGNFNQLNLPEGAAASGISATDVLYGLSASHWPAFNPNSAGERSLCGSTGTFTSGHIVAANSSGTICDLVDGGTGTGSGSVTTITSGDFSPLFTVGIADPGTTPAITFTASNAAAHKIFMNNTAGSATPAFQSLGAADEPATTVNSVVNDTNVTGSISAQAFTLGWTGALAAARGGTDQSSYTKGDTLCPSAATTMTKLAVGTNAKVLTANSAATCGIDWEVPPATASLQTNTVVNASQTLLNFISTGGANGINFTNPSSGFETGTIANTTGGGNAVITGTLTGLSQGDLLCADATPSIVNCAAGVPVNIQTGATYTVVGGDGGTSDRSKMITIHNASAIAVTLPQAGSTGFGSNFFFSIKNVGTGTNGAVTITPTTSTIDGNATLVLLAGQSAGIMSDGANYVSAVRGYASSTSGSISGAIIGVGCDAATVTINGAAVGMGVSATPNTYPGDGLYWNAYVSAANTITVKVCSDVTLTPTASTYYVKVLNP